MPRRPDPIEYRAVYGTDPSKNAELLSKVIDILNRSEVMKKAEQQLAEKDKETA
ncbi:hypothetical protein GTO91_13800 [Heliobacterium undosum]|uniref:Uncharacterized protein n=1 Tax=Heliomicrobium undosum TaxID=121734 RepID=A0A845LAS7_9FIRM|nr:hypothetical protein [Heliomicrobium undosum]MZP30788.1 hypothetical protein [Heliomicrobium undosum]